MRTGVARISVVAIVVAALGLLPGAAQAAKHKPYWQNLKGTFIESGDQSTLAPSEGGRFLLDGHIDFSGGWVGSSDFTTIAGFSDPGYVIGERSMTFKCKAKDGRKGKLTVVNNFFAHNGVGPSQAWIVKSSGGLAGSSGEFTFVTENQPGFDTPATGHYTGRWHEGTGRG